MPILPLTVESREARADITDAMIRGNINILSNLRNISPGSAISDTASAE